MMPEKLKDVLFSLDSLHGLADAIAAVHPQFDREGFLSLVQSGGWEQRELKDRMRHVTQCLHRALARDFTAALDILKRVAPSLSGFYPLVCSDYVQCYGQDHWELSLPALAFFTPFGTSEYAVRPFIAQDPSRAMAVLMAWAEDRNHHVRRLASEGCRPSLPWGMDLPMFQEDPAPILPILEKLKDDQSEYVRKSVANNLNAISKDHPDLVLDIAERWYGHNPRTDWIVRHGLRTLLKAGNLRALQLLGVAEQEKVHVEALTLDRATLHIGQELHYGFTLRVDGQTPCQVRLELAVDYVRGRGELSRKVFAIRSGRFAPGRCAIARKLSFADRSTRRHYPGRHHLTVIANGVEQATASVELAAARPEQA
jgi:3-methyladenine DNA glycosylase AlkC